MNKLIEKINKNENTIMVVCILIIAACIIFLFYLHSNEISNNKFIFNKNLEENIFTIEQEEKKVMNIDLQEFSYYIIVAEANTQMQALFFNEDAPESYWNLKTSPRENLRSVTKDFCIDTCIRDNLIYLEALENDYSLDKEELEYAKSTSLEIYKNLTAEQVHATAIELEDIFNIQKKIFLAEKYTLSLIEDNVITHKSELSSDGAYYLENIKPHYNIEENDLILDEILFGNITVNVENEVE